MTFRKVAAPLLAMPQGSKQAVVGTIDCALCALSVWAAFYLRLGEFVYLTGQPSIAVALSIAFALPTFWLTGLYRIALRGAGVEVIPAVGFACLVYCLCFATIISAYGIEGVPRTIGLIQPILLFLGACSTRIAAGWFLSGNARRSSARPEGRVLIYGAGASGRQLAAAMSTSRESKVVGFIDDDRSLHGRRVNGLPVFSPEQLGARIDREQITDVLLALPSASRQRRNDTIERLRGLPVGVRTLPGLMDLAHGRVNATDLRELTIEDLLSRDAVAQEPDAIRRKIAGRIILVTGAGGSIGSELCRQIALAEPALLLLLEASEFALYSIHRSLEKAFNVAVIPLLGSVIDSARMAEIFRAWRPDMVFHAAAYKHVPLVEHNPLEGLRNNVLGTLRVAQLAAEYGVSDFVLVSTDKAVRPTNVMGATKRLAELVLQALAAEGTGTRFSMVRFGNVLGSSGSVVPLFREQIRHGGPVTITHPDITRYFMTIPEAAQLVVQASTIAKGGEVFVLDMGAPVRIIDLARNMIDLSGLTARSDDNPAGDIEIKIIGVRPGEKLFEELLIGNDPQTTPHPRIMMATEHHLPWATLGPELHRLDALIREGDVAACRLLLRKLVVEYAPVSDVCDWVVLQDAAVASEKRGADAAPAQDRLVRAH